RLAQHLMAPAFLGRVQVPFARVDLVGQVEPDGTYDRLVADPAADAVLQVLHGEGGARVYLSRVDEESGAPVAPEAGERQAQLQVGRQLAQPAVRLVAHAGDVVGGVFRRAVVVVADLAFARVQRVEA